METGMDGHEGQAHYVKRVVLPSGKTIEVVYFNEPEQPSCPSPEQDQDLQVCLDCDSELVYPVDWEEAGPENWTVLLHCPNCDMQREGIFHQDTVERFDEALDGGAEQLASDYRRLVRANMADEVDRFVSALEADAILPEDF
ncbi:MAG: hypothetical protein ABR581_01435 [Thermoleophilaceae bacterium]